jgi:ABC-2 type transport system permease protein
MTLVHWLRVYAQFARCAFQRRAAYRLANWTGMVVNFAFFVIHAEVIRAFYAARGPVAGWSVDEAVVYYAVSQALLMVVGAFPDRSFPLHERIRSGEVAVDLARPVDLLPRDLAERYGSALYYLGTRGVVIYAAGLLFYGLAPPLSCVLLLAPLSLALAIAVSGALWYLANAAAFWSQHAMGALHVTMLALVFFGGLEIPLAFYPDWLRALCDALPFRAAFYTPVALVTGHLAGGELARALGHQVLWLAALLGCARAVERAGLRRLVIQGG